MSERIFSGKSSQKFWDAVNKYKDDILYEYGRKAQEIEQQRDDLLAACENFPTANQINLFANFAEECTEKPSMAIYKGRFMTLAAFLRSCEDRVKKVEAAIAKAQSVTPKAKGKI